MSTAICFDPAEEAPHAQTVQLGDRIKWARLRAELGVNEIDRRVAELVGKGEKAFGGRTSRAESGDTEPDLEYIHAAARVLGVRAEWLAFGTGERFPDAGGKIPERISQLAAGMSVSAADIHLTARQLEYTSLDSVGDGLIVRLLDEAAHFRRLAEDCIELEAHRSSRTAPKSKRRQRA